MWPATIGPHCHPARRKKSLETPELQHIYNFTMSNELPEKTYKQEKN